VCALIWLAACHSSAAPARSDAGRPDGGDDATRADARPRDADGSAGDQVSPPVDGGAAQRCALDACALTCDPTDTWFAVSNGPGTGVGDSEPATPAEVGDGLWHLFVGVNTVTDGGTPYALVYDSTSSAPDAPFTLAAHPLNDVADSYDAHGKEAPAYLRADPHTEYVYYSGVGSFDPPQAAVAALKRVDGGAWTKVGVVSPLAPGEVVQTDPTVAFDPASGQTVLLYMSLLTPPGSSEGAQLGIVSRVTTNPELFAASTQQWITRTTATPGMVEPARPALSRDDVAGVWRIGFDLADYAGTTAAYHTLQRWMTTPIPDASVLSGSASAEVLHDGNHALHPQLHVDGTQCTAATCPQGAVLQPSKAIYPDGGDVIFYYSGWSTLPGLQVNGQRCTRAR